MKKYILLVSTENPVSVDTSCNLICQYQDTKMYCGQVTHFFVCEGFKKIASPKKTKEEGKTWLLL